VNVGTVKADAADETGDLGAVLAAYLEACDAGSPPDRSEFIARHAELRHELEEFFRNRDDVLRVARPAGDVATADYNSQIARLPVWAADPVPGEVIAGRYQIISTTAGGMGRIYFARDLDASKKHGAAVDVALKTVPTFEDWRRLRSERGRPASLADYEHLHGRFEREALTWIGLDPHPNVIAADPVFEVGGRPFLPLEFANGGDLRARLGFCSITLPLAVNFAVQVCEGMRAAFLQAGLVHRDLKPGNILIHDYHTIKVTDLGLARAFTADLGPGSAHDHFLSAEGAGSRPYMAPEQFESLSSADTRSDIFSFGAVLSEMLTRRSPFLQRDAREMAKSGGLPVPPDRPGVPSALSHIVRRCLDYDPARRYQSFSELLDELKEVHDSLPNPVPLPSNEAQPPMGHSDRAVGEVYSLISLGRHDVAESRSSRAIAIDGDEARHWINRGKALAELDQLEEARECYMRATLLEPNDAIGWTNLSATFIDCHPSEARRLAERAIAVDAVYAEAWMNLGLSEKQLGRFADARHHIKRAIELSPHDWKAHFNLGTLAVQVENHAEAVAALTESARLNPGCAETWSTLAYTHGRLRNLDAALEAVDRALALTGSQADSWVLRAILLLEAGSSVDLAHASIARARELEPANQNLLRLLSERPELANQPLSTGEP